MGVTDNRDDPGLKVIDERGMQQKYLVLSDEERRKGFIRPLRKSYRHVGIPGPDPSHELRDLTPEQKERYGDEGYIKYEVYPNDDHSESTVVGRFWTQEQLDAVGKGCGTLTWMNEAIAETYARQPGFYGGTYCAGCKTHLPVGRDGEFVWEGTDERVGT